MGPFVDASNSAVLGGKISDLPENLIRNVLLTKLQILMQKSPQTKIVVAPSLQEFSHDFTFPQCALQASLLGDLHKVPLFNSFFLSIFLIEPHLLAKSRAVLDERGADRSFKCRCFAAIGLIRGLPKFPSK